MVVLTCLFPFFTLLKPNMRGATSWISCPASMSAAASKRVSLISPNFCPASPAGREETTRTHPEPRSLKRLFTAKKKPCTTETTAMTDATPMRTPRMVRKERSLLAQRDFSASAMFSSSISSRGGRGAPLRSRRHRKPAGFLDVILHDLPVSQVDDAPRAAGDVVLVGDQHDRVPLFVQLAEEGHDLLAGAR